MPKPRKPKDASSIDRLTKLKLGFEESFSSEAILQQAIANLLTRMPDITGVQILQGPNELGKDLIFYIRGGFGEPVLCACVVKNTKISGDVSKSSGARTVFHQAEQAFDSTHINSSGTEVRVERVYVITPFGIPQAAIASIAGKLRERAGQIVFMGGSSLFDLFKRYWPDYFADEAELISNHLSTTKRAAQSDERLQGLATQYNLGPIKTYATKIYVKQTLYQELKECSLGARLIDQMPDLKSFANRFTGDDLRHFDSKLDALRRSFAFLADWDLCGTVEKEAVDQVSRAVISQLTNVKKKLDAKAAIEKELVETREAEKAVRQSKGSGPADGAKRLKTQTELSARITALKVEAAAELTIAQNKMGELSIAKNTALHDLEKQLRELRYTVASRRLAALDTLTDEAYSRAATLNNCVHAAPPNMFKLSSGMRIEFPKDILNQCHGDLLIVGAPGFGKTSFCRWHALQDAENFTTDRSNVLPVYIPLYRLSKSQLGSFEETFLENLGRSALLGSEPIAKTGCRIRLYLDGLDEIASSARRREVVELARNPTRKNKNDHFQIILTSRDYIYAPWLDWCPRVTIGGFQNADVEELVGRWLGAESESCSRFWNQIDKLPSLRPLMHTPLLATLILMVFKQTGKLPESKSRLYEIFVNLLSGGWDLAKGVLRESKFGERIKVHVLTTLSTNLHNQRRREFNAYDLRVATTSVLTRAVAKDWEMLHDELIADGLVTKSGDVLQLAHHSFQEFLTAKDSMGSPEPLRINKAVESYLCGDEWWKEVVQFYIGLSTNPNDIVTWLRERMRHAASNSSAQISAVQVEALSSAVLDTFPESRIEDLSSLKYYSN